MPNWCMNELVLNGPKDILEEIAETKLSLAKLVPWPEELTGYQKIMPVPKGEKKARAALMKKYGYDNLYDWCVNNWGTKWDIGDLDIISVEEFSIPLGKNGKKIEYQIFVTFDSAWAPPVEAFKFIYNKYKDKGLRVSLEYLEPGCSFIGTAKGDGGEFEDDYYEYSNVDELRDIVKKLGDHGLGESELYSMESDIEYEEDIVKEETKKEPAKKKVTVKKIAKKAPAKKVAAKKSVKKVESKKTTSKQVKTKKEKKK